MKKPANKKVLKKSPTPLPVKKAVPVRGIRRLPRETEDVYGSQRRVGQIQTSITLGSDLLKWAREESDRLALHNVSALIRQLLLTAMKSEVKKPLKK